MRKSILLALAGLFSITIVYSQSLVWSNDQPKVGEKVSFTYNPASTPFANEKNIEAVAYCLAKTGGDAKEIPLKKTGNTFTGTFVTDTNTVLVAMKFSAGEKNDPNRNNGYMLTVRDKQGKIQPGTYNAFADQYAGYGKYLYGLDPNEEYAFNYRVQEWKEFPENRLENLSGYLQAIASKKKKEAEPEMLKLLDDMVAAGNLKEAHYNGIGTWYTRLKQKEKADALLSQLKEKFPDGLWKKNEKLAPFIAEKDPVKKEALLNEFLAAYPPTTEAEKTTAGFYYSTLANAFANPEYVKNSGVEKMKFYAAKMPESQRASFYNNTAWGYVGKDMFIEDAKEMSLFATQFTKKELTSPSEKKPGMLTVKDWQKSRADAYAMYADTYAYILYKQNDYKQGFKYAKEAAVDVAKKKDSDLNETYALLLEKLASPAEVQKELSPMVKENKLGPKGKGVLQRVLVANLGSQEKADAYYAGLMAEVRAAARKELEKKMINEDAATFKLKNLKGEDVSLASLKGKVVVLDFWATWCGPCISSFPGMQKTIDKYKNNENVVFLFVNTWESQETLDQRKKEVSEFIAKNKYNFNVLYDESENNTPNNYVVVNNYKVTGIPTKFVIGKDGKMRFRSVGFGGGEDGLVEELSAMIDMAGSK